MREDSKPPAAMAVEIDENIDAIVANALRNRRVRHAADRAPVGGVAANGLGQVIDFEQVGIDVGMHEQGIVVDQDRDQESRQDVTAEIARQPTNS